MCRRSERKREWHAERCAEGSGKAGVAIPMGFVGPMGDTNRLPCAAEPVVNGSQAGGGADCCRQWLTVVLSCCLSSSLTRGSRGATSFRSGSLASSTPSVRSASTSARALLG